MSAEAVGAPRRPELDGFLDGFLDRHRAALVALRRDLHAHPELSGREHRTTDVLAARLRAAGLSPRVLSSGTGLLCDVGPGGGRRVALRADIDALAMVDEKEVAYRSTVPGAAHACGHDVHATVLLGAGLALAEVLAAGQVRLVFEPAEESVPGGAVTVIADGGLDDVDAIFGLHCDPKLDVGLVGVRPGAITSATDALTVTLHGPGGHTARPHLTVDLVAVAGRVAAELPARVRARAAPLGELLLVFGSLHAGDAANVIPSNAVLRGTVRTPARAAWDAAHDVVTAALEEQLGPTDATWTLDYRRGLPPVVNHEHETEVLTAAARAELGDDAIREASQSFGGDSFAWYVERVPGSFARLGVHDPARADRLDLHASTFDVHEAAIDVGVRVLVRTALDALDAGASSPRPATAR